MNLPSPWPHLSDEPFREAPEYAENVQIDALPIYGGVGRAYVQGYKDAADKLVETVVATETNRDIFLIPIVYLYRHYLELQLKTMLREARDAGVSALSGMTDKQLSTEPGHNLDVLRESVRQFIEELWPDELRDDLSKVARIVQRFHEFDKTGQRFRYAFDKTGQHFIYAGDLTHMPRLIDLKHLKSVMDSVDIYLCASMERLHV